MSAAIQTATEFVSGREAARAKKRADVLAGKERAAIARAEFDRLHGIEVERQAEDQAPRHQRVPVTTSTDGQIVVLREPLAVPDIKRGGFRRSNPLMHMFAVGKGRTITRRHVAAASLFSLDYETGVCGANPGRNPLAEPVDNGDGMGSEDRMLAAIDRYNSACRALGPSMRCVVERVVLECQGVERIAPLMGVTVNVATGIVVAALTVLDEHYHPDKPVPRAEIHLIDPTVTDLPQERLGRRIISA